MYLALQYGFQQAHQFLQGAKQDVHVSQERAEWKREVATLGYPSKWICLTAPDVQISYHICKKMRREEKGTEHLCICKTEGEDEGSNNHWRGNKEPAVLAMGDTTSASMQDEEGA